MAAGFREGFVEADGFRIRYMEAGKGRHSQGRERLQSAPRPHLDRNTPASSLLRRGPLS
jgi:hypothetical protein